MGGHVTLNINSATQVLSKPAETRAPKDSIFEEDVNHEHRQDTEVFVNEGSKCVKQRDEMCSQATRVEELLC